jgi:Nucleotidyltransferase/Protein of unknown function (DUF1488)
VNVPNPARFGWHKLVIALQRQNREKAGKDIEQAAALIRIMAEQSPADLKDAAQDFIRIAPSKRQLLLRKALAQLPIQARDTALRILEWPRRAIPGAHLDFANSRGRWDAKKQVLLISANENGFPVQFAISREALEDYFHVNDASGRTRWSHSIKIEPQSSVSPRPNISIIRSSRETHLRIGRSCCVTLINSPGRSQGRSPE